MALNKLNLQSGITLIELVVVLAIVAIVSSVTIFNYSGFSTNVSLRNLAQQIALATRKAQTYATSVHSIMPTGQESSIYPAYGISFSSYTPSGTYAPGTKQIVLFADLSPSGDNGYGRYDGGSTCGIPSVNDECLEMFTITTGDRIENVCPNGQCFSTGGTVDIVFRRPSPDARICIPNASTCTSISYVDIKIRSAKGVEKTITIWNTGQISTS